MRKEVSYRDAPAYDIQRMTFNVGYGKYLSSGAEHVLKVLYNGVLGRHVLIEHSQRVVFVCQVTPEDNDLLCERALVF